MNNYKIYISKEGKIGVIEMPIEASEKLFSGDQWKENQARLAYESALTKAKENVVMFKDQDHTGCLVDPCYIYGDKFTPDTIHDIPSDYSVEVEENEIPCPDGREGCEVLHLEKVATLKKLPYQQPSPIVANSGKEEYFKMPVFKTSFGDNLEIDDCLFKEIFDSAISWKSHLHPNQKYRESDCDICKKATLVALKYILPLQSEITRLQAQLKEKESHFKV